MEPKRNPGSFFSRFGFSDFAMEGRIQIGQAELRVDAVL